MVREGVGVIEKQSCKIAAKAIAGISVFTIKWLSCQGDPLKLKKYVCYHLG